MKKRNSFEEHCKYIFNDKNYCEACECAVIVEMLPF